MPWVGRSVKIKGALFALVLRRKQSLAIWFTPCASRRILAPYSDRTCLSVSFRTKEIFRVGKHEDLSLSRPNWYYAQCFNRLALNCRTSFTPAHPSPAVMVANIGRSKLMT
jgi:hypothetical protein